MNDPLIKEFDCGLEVQPSAEDLQVQECINPDKLLRLNPFWFVENLRVEDRKFTADLKDYRNENEFQLSGELIYDDSNLLTVTFLNGEWEKISLFIKEDKQLWAEVQFREQVAKEDSEEEQNLIYWLRGIKEYLRLYFSKTVNTLFFRLVMNKMILKMNPSQRKICVMLIRFTILEIVVIAIIVVGYFAFMKE